MNPLFSLLVAGLAWVGYGGGGPKKNVLYVLNVNVEMHLCGLLILYIKDLCFKKKKSYLAQSL